MTGQHRGARAPWWVRLQCWLYAHNIEQLGHRAWHCTRCGRCGPTPVEMT